MRKKASLIALYLPQYHEVRENSLWWGEGFTDWISVKNAEPCFLGHNQPKIPYKSEYYNLMEKRVMERQVNMSLKAGIEGFCFYHYWFNGKKILEKPVENYLKWTDLNQKFCLSWANESWIRTWSNIDGNDWNPLGDQKECSNREQSVLIEQKYGNHQQWKEHFEYLLPFFLDRRYIRIDGKPVLLIYRPDIIPCLCQMTRYWKSLARKSGLKGLYIIVTNPSGEYSRIADGVLLYEPGYTFRNGLQQIQGNKTKPELYDFCKIWREILLRRKKCSLPVFLGAFAGYDDTPRRGKNGTVVVNNTPQKFARYLKLLLKKSERREYGKYIFVTAWNEWGEGAYLEPDEQNGFRYLGACKWALDHRR